MNVHIKRKGTISLIIPSHNEENNIERCLDSIYPFSKDIEIIVVDSSTDKTPRILQEKRYGFIKILHVPTDSFCGENRNMGIKRATGKILAFIDADTEITPEWLPELKKSMEHNDIVAGFSPDPNGKHLPRVPIIINGQDITYPTCNIAYKKEVFNKTGLFREDMKRGSDCEFNYRCTQNGYIIYYNPRMKIYHYQRKTLTGFMKQAFWNGYARYELNNMHEEIKNNSNITQAIKNMFRYWTRNLIGGMGYILGGKIDA